MTRKSIDKYLKTRPELYKDGTLWTHLSLMLRKFRQMRQGHKKSRLRAALLLLLLVTACPWVEGQVIEVVPDIKKDTCAISCASDTGDCHLNRALFLISHKRYQTRGCPEEDYASLGALKDVERSSAAVMELEKAIANTSRTGDKLVYVYELLASTRITLGNSLLAAGRHDDAEKSFTDASTLYIRISQLITDVDDLASLGEGIIRAGKPVEAIKYLTPLPNTSSIRAYLLAEAYFTLGQRESSAAFYENWIDLGCQSNPTMVLNDEYSQRWLLLLSNRPRCEQLPNELRARLELLHRQYRRPKNLPAKNYPGSIMLSH